MGAADSIDAYIGGFPLSQQKLLKQMRKLIRKTAPDAEEAISYGMPTFRLHGNLVHFAMAKHHLGFYPGPSAISQFKTALKVYPGSKGAIQLPLDQPLPEELVAAIVKFRVDEQNEKARKKSLRTCRQGHQYYKTTDCPVCPVCEAARKPANGFLAQLSAPARRALEHAGITTLAKLSKYSETEILRLHGIGKASIPVLQAALKGERLKFAKD